MIVPRLRAPIVLVHGLLGFDEITVGRWTVARNFPKIPEFLGTGGNRVLVARLSPTGGVEQRARELQAFLQRKVPFEPVHLFAHSLGGLDCRYLISRLGMASRVLTLTTIGTPHRGTAFADWGVHRFKCFLEPVFDWLNLPAQAFFDLTTARCREFNAQVPDAPGVRYFAVAGRHYSNWWTPEWTLPHSIVLEAEGENDGVVSLASATYGESTEVWEGDHLSLINLPYLLAHVRGRWQDRSPRYGDLVRRLGDEGF
jgi:triacylglycerol lipase